MKKESRQKIWIVAAGTGGHIFPGIALANELKIRRANLDIEFFGTKERLEEKIIPRHGYPITFLRAKQWKGRGLRERFPALLALLASWFWALKKAIRDRPLCLISVGGYGGYAYGASLLDFGDSNFSC